MAGRHLRPIVSNARNIPPAISNATSQITPPTDRGQHTASDRPVPMPTNERLKPSSSVTKMGSLVAPKRIIDCVASVALTMKRRLSLTQVDGNCTGSKKAREADALPGANADWSSPDPQVDSPLTSNPLLSLALADSKHRRGLGHPHKQGSATTVFATGTLSAPSQANETKTSTYKHTIILGAPSSSSAIHQQQNKDHSMPSLHVFIPMIIPPITHIQLNYPLPLTTTLTLADEHGNGSGDGPCHGKDAGNAP